MSVVQNRKRESNSQHLSPENMLSHRAAFNWLLFIFLDGLKATLTLSFEVMAMMGSNRYCTLMYRGEISDMWDVVIDEGRFVNTLTVVATLLPTI